MTPGITQILIIALILIVLFGASRLGEIGKGLGEGIKSFKKGLGDQEPEGGGDALPKEGDTSSSARASDAEKQPAKRNEDA